MENGFERYIRVTLQKPCRVLSMGVFFFFSTPFLPPSPPWFERFPVNKVGECYLPGKSVFMEGPAAFLRRPYISIFIKLCHSAFIYFILPLSSPPARTGPSIKVASARGSRGCPDERYAPATRPYDPLRNRAQERRDGVSRS